MSYELKPLSAGEVERWDELIASFSHRELFHRQTWLKYLAASRGIDLHYWSIQENERTIGYFCAGSLRKGPFRILGSPLKGWGTNFMGPVVGEGFNGADFLAALDKLADREGFAVAEIESRHIAADLMASFGYTPVGQPTYIVDLTPEDPDKMWSRIDVKSRQKIRKARRNGITIEQTDDPGIAYEFYEQFVEVLARKNLSPPYDRECPRHLFNVLRPHKMLYAFKVCEPDGSIIATGLFPHDEKTLYYWGGASRLAGWNHSPNDLLQWTAMEVAAADGLTEYNMCGYGYFKSKFGGRLEEPQRWHKCYQPGAAIARRLYSTYFQTRIRLRGWCERVISQRRAS